jgi:hypothetical protein
MALSTAVLAAFAQLDKATNDIAARLATLASAHPDDADLQTAIGAEVTKLQGLASNPAVPVPGIAPPAGLTA